MSWKRRQMGVGTSLLLETNPRCEENEGSYEVRSPFILIKTLPPQHLPLARPIVGKLVK